MISALFAEVESSDSIQFLKDPAREGCPHFPKTDHTTKPPARKFSFCQNCHRTDGQCITVNAYNSYCEDMSATKRIPVSETVWRMLSELKQPGQTYDSLLEEIVANEKQLRFTRKMEKVESQSDFEELLL